MAQQAVFLLVAVQTGLTVGASRRTVFRYELLRMGQGYNVAAVAKALLAVAHQTLIPLGAGLRPMRAPPIGALVALRLGHPVVTDGTQGLLLLVQGPGIRCAVHIVAGIAFQQALGQGVMGAGFNLLGHALMALAARFPGGTEEQMFLLYRPVYFVTGGTGKFHFCVGSSLPPFRFNALLVAFEADGHLLTQLKSLPGNDYLPLPGHVPSPRTVAGFTAALVGWAFFVQENLAVADLTPAAREIDVTDEADLCPRVPVLRLRGRKQWP